MKILHLTTHWTGGGSERNIAHTVECLRDAGHEVHLAIGRVVQEDTVPLPSGIAIHRVASLARAPRPFADARAFLAVRSLVHREKFDVVHTHLAKAGFVGRLGSWRSSAAVAHTVHNAITLHTPLYRRLDRLAARRTTALVFVGQELRDMYATRIGVAAPKLHVIRSAVGASSFVQLRDQRHTARGGILRAVLVSRLVRDKGVDVMPDVLATVPAVRLDVAGSGPLERELRSRCADAGVSSRVTFHGYLEQRNLARLVARADVLLHVSTKVEGLPQAVVQALAAGIPVIAMRSVGISELVLDGVNGIVAGPTADAVSAALKRLLEEPGLLHALTDGARTFDASPWLEDVICRQHLELVEKLRRSA